MAQRHQTPSPQPYFIADAGYTGGIEDIASYDDEQPIGKSLKRSRGLLFLDSLALLFL